jgi:hypothetical protein
MNNDLMVERGLLLPLCPLINSEKAGKVTLCNAKELNLNSF